MVDPMCLMWGDEWIQDGELLGMMGNSLQMKIPHIRYCLGRLVVMTIKLVIVPCMDL